MASDEEPAKQLLPYLQRADELQKHDPLVAYYCRLFAMERGLKIPQSDRTKTTNALLISLMNQLEKDKKSVKLGPDDHLHLEGFALNIFAKADKQDRAGRADLNSAKTFYAASIFFEILNQFGPLPPDLEQKQKYAAWKAADIRKALKEGRQPLAGPPGGDDNDLHVPSSTSSGEYDLGTNRSDSASNTNQPGPVLSSDSSHQVYDQNDFYNPTSILPQPSNVMPAPSPSSDTPHPTYSTDGYSPNNLHQPPSTNSADQSIYHQSYHPQPYQPEPQQHFPHQYPSHNMSPYSYPNFQSYPSLTDSSLPTVPTHYPSRSQGSEVPYATSSPSNTAAFPLMSQNNSSSRILEVSPSTVEKYEYDSSYQPTPEKVAEAHKAARFAVGALAFDDVATAVDYLKKSLELLTNPSAGH